MGEGWHKHVSISKCILSHQAVPKYDYLDKQLFGKNCIHIARSRSASQMSFVGYFSG